MNKQSLFSAVTMLIILIIGCKKAESKDELPNQPVYATSISIKSNNENPEIGSLVSFTPVYEYKVDKISWFIDDVDAKAVSGASVYSNVLSFMFKDNKEHSIKVVASVKDKEITGTKKIGVAKKFNVIAFYNGTYDLAHINFVKEANEWFPKAGEQYGFTYTATNDWSKLNETFLAQYQVVLFLDDRAPKAREAAFQAYMEKGGGWMGFHVCAFNTNPAEWDWYYNKFLGVGSFKNNTWFPTTAVLKCEDQKHPSTLRLPETFTSSVSEWYSWTKDLRQNPDIKVLCSVHESSFPLGTDPKQSWYSGYYPIMWTNNKYKMLYANFGHNAMDYAANVGKSSTFGSEIQNKFIIDGLLWLGKEK